jgi:chromosomal replication initiator protein
MGTPARAHTNGQDTTMDDKEVVAAVLAALAERIGDDRVELWFGPNVRVVARQSTLVVQTPSEFHQNWLRRNFRGDLEAACADVLGRPLAVEFRVSAALGGKNKVTRPAAVDCQRRFEFDEPADAEVAGAEETATLVLERPRPVTAALPQPTLSLGRKYASLDSFVLGSSNRLAHTGAKMVTERPGNPNPLFVYGPTGVGKTHLLEGILSETRRLHGGSHAVFLTAEQFTTSFLEALHRRGFPSFRSKFVGLNLLVIDDLQFFAGKRATAVEFMHTLDRLVRDGRQVVVSADRSPAELRELSPELSTRLAGGMVAKMEPADHATRLGIVRNRAKSLGLEIDADVAEYLATHLTAHARELTGALNQLLATSRIHGAAITRAIAEEALADMILQEARPIAFQQIEKAVCEMFGLGAESLQASCRAKALVAPRMLAMWLARKHTRAALSEIGQYFGQRSHSTVISAQKTVGKWMAEHAKLRLGSKDCEAEDAIRRVEAKLRAG